MQISTLNFELSILGAFVMGVFLGSFLTAYFVKREGSVSENRVLSGFVSVVVVLAWIASVGRDIYFGDWQTPTFLWIFMGAVIGALNPIFGNFLLKLIKK